MVANETLVALEVNQKRALLRKQESLEKVVTPKPQQQTALEFVLDYPPSVNHYWKHRRGSSTPYLSAEARLYKARIQHQYRAAIPIDGEVVVVVDVYRPRKAGDLDNSLKAILDSLKGIAYVDDKQIVELVARRHDDKERPRVEVTVSHMGNCR